MYTVYFNIGEGWTYDKTYNEFISAIKAMQALSAQGAKVQYTSPLTPVERELYD